MHSMKKYYFEEYTGHRYSDALTNCIRILYENKKARCAYVYILDYEEGKAFKVTKVEWKCGKINIVGDILNSKNINGKLDKMFPNISIVILLDNNKVMIECRNYSHLHLFFSFYEYAISWWIKDNCAPMHQTLRYFITARYDNRLPLYITTPITFKIKCVHHYYQGLCTEDCTKLYKYILDKSDDRKRNLLHILLLDVNTNRYNKFEQIIDHYIMRG